MFLYLSAIEGSSAAGRGNGKISAIRWLHPELWQMQNYVSFLSDRAPSGRFERGCLDSGIL